MLILGIESSCDETAAALLGDRNVVLSSVVASQVKTHRSFGGVVPELASREHLRNIGWVIRQAFNDAGKTYDAIDGIAVTQGPGLIGSLLVGVSFAKAMAYSLKKPLVPVNHVEGHIYSAFIEHPQIEYPLLALVVSGGHTSLIFSPEPGQYQSIGRARDDAAGEALDKLAKFLGLGYPGGPVIDRLAKDGDPRRFLFSIPKISDGRLDFSFSGFKTAALRHIQLNGIKPRRPGAKISRIALDLVTSYQQAIIDTLVRQTRKAAAQQHPRSILLVGGVACNSLLRKTFKATFEVEAQRMTGCEPVRVYYPSPALTTDNAAMIAAAGRPKLERAGPLDLELNAFADLRLC
ncbi:MAG TPA: tRNA (adenosine(37)-N6)-threonylcarbamoyltransferase complex transferase subunit TsaD [Acidobacteriota bacterium]|nr:tRNA (adenosine(37)-N6)-threonylcarbamoyltransferase complex transferase subunit TsaD [Acidobacteriota bacterium]